MRDLQILLYTNAFLLGEFFSLLEFESVESVGGGEGGPHYGFNSESLTSPSSKVFHIAYNHLSLFLPTLLFVRKQGKDSEIRSKPGEKEGGGSHSALLKKKSEVADNMMERY